LTSLFDFLRRNGRLVAFGFLMCFCSSLGQTFFISLFNGELRSAFNLSHGEIGSMYAAGTIASAATLLLAGRLVDRYRLSLVTAVVLGGLALAMTGMAFVWSTLALPVVFYGLRLFGQGLATHTGMTAMGRYFDQARGRAISLATLGFSTGEALLPGLTVAALGAIHWRSLWLVAAGGALLALPLAQQLLRGVIPADAGSPVAVSASGAVRQYRLGEVLSEPAAWLRMPTLLAPAFIVTGLFFHQVHLAEDKGWPLSLLAMSFSLFAAMSFVTTLAAGPLVDGYSARRILPWLLIPLTLACLALSASDHPLVAPGFMMLLGLTTGIYGILGTAIWPELYGVRHLGAIKGFAQASMVLSSGLSPVIFGVLLDRGVPFAALTAASAVACGLAALMAAAANRLETRAATQTA
jgi:MFS family permease